MNDQKIKAHDLFLLMFNLSQLTAEEKIIDVFMQALKEIWPDTSVFFSPAKTDDENNVIEIAASNSNFGFIKIDKLPDLKSDDQDLLHNAVAMLAIILKKNEQDKFLANEKLHLQKLVDEKVKTITLSERKYNDIFNNIQDVYYETSMDGIILEVSPSIDFFSKGQYSREYLLGKSMSDFYADSASRQNLLLLLQEKGRVNDYEVMLKNRDGSTIPCSITVKIHRDHDGRLVKIIGSMRDITERRQTEKALQERNEQLSLALDVGNAGIWEWHLKNDRVDFDDRFQIMLGYAPGELPDSLQEWLSYHHPADIPVWQSKAESYLKGNSPGYESEHRIRSKAGTWNWVFTRGKLASPELFIGIAMNITERKQAEITHLETMHRLQRLYESGMLGVIYWNTDGQILDANDKFLEMIGYTRDDLENGRINWVNMTPPEYHYLDDNSVVELKATGVNKKPFEKIYIRKDGTRLPIIIAGAMLDEQRVNGIAFVIDITDRKRLESQWEVALDKIRELNEGLEQRIQERTSELRETIAQLEKTNRLFVGRELRMIELKARIAELEKRNA